MIPAKPDHVQWTDAQWESIYAKDQDILVAAAAGSGKTAVLVERIIQRILRDEIDVDRLLVVTFTNLSAREMKHRVEARIQQAALADPSNQHLKNQRSKIHQAQISTLHSFCLRLIQQHYDVLEIDPNFRTASEVENILLLEQVIDDVLEKHYEQLDPTFVTLTEHISTDRDDSALRQIIKQLYHFSVAHPDPIEWLNTLDQPYLERHLQQQYLDTLNKYIRLYLEAAQDAIEEAYHQFEWVGDFPKHVTFISKHRDFLRRVLAEPQIDKNRIAEYQLGRMPTKPKDVKEDPMLDEAYDVFKMYYESFKNNMNQIKTHFLGRDDETLLEELYQLAPRVNYLARLTKDVLHTFSQAKRARNILDFSDYEHFALQILRDGDGNPSEIAQAYREHFKEILVDEYQDTNRVQESIIASIKRGDESNGNLFMVGDVKQSIYKFRQADPSLFIEKYQRFNQPEQPGGWRIDLSQNFRSRPAVLSTTNYLFTHMMDTEVGEIEYDDAAKLYHGASYDAVELPVQFNVLMVDQDREMTASEQEAHLIVQQVQTILETKKVYDSKTQTYRPAQYKDIVILERSYSNARLVQQAFKDRDIPLFVNSKQGYFEQTEIRLMLSFLRTIDNPLQDIYLVGLMRSMIYQFTEDELAKIRVVAPQDNYFYQSIQHYLASDEAEPAIVAKLEKFLNDLAFYQDYSLHHPVYQLIDQLFNDHYIIQYFSALIGGRGRRANLYGLFNKAVDFENSSFRGLFQFIRFIDQMIARGKDFGEENVIGPNDNVVRMMTIHSSKGLEFPFVIYSGLTRQFNKSDLGKAVVLNQHAGLGLQYYDEAQGLFYPSLISMSIDLVNQKEMISEEMRLIYVAFTRAKEQLFLIGTAKQEKELEVLASAPIANQKLTVMDRFNAKNPFQLLYSVFSKYQNSALQAHQRFESDATTLAPVVKPHIQVQHLEAETVLPTEQDLVDNQSHSLEALEAKLASTPIDDQVAKQIEQQLLFEYPYQQAVQQASKQSVSELKRQLETEQADTNYERVRQYRLGIATYDRPQFLQEVKYTAAEIGTLMHTVMQHLPFVEDGFTEQALNQFLTSLVERSIIPAEALQVIAVDEIQRFINSPLYARIAKSEERHTEVPFVVNQHEVEETNVSTDASMIQGMIDLVFKENGHYYFVDYKTDALIRRRGISDAEMEMMLKQKYRVQMQYYQRALETILKTPVNGYLYFFKYGELEI
ncbi:helicase-exonuclease AddAB subunit AddA [Staphylococcus lutrae]|uniref:ATP-dependent helicase/nuclease subunit A n=1 Tax=Staphylococcus lutrae TaxID=155085 RepID=A0AAC9WK31_9STAP|nr:helicase-exonuclease AddAB subunit AddA [Staphylococcus lutrae]ARJ51406.1 helicase-exonuclease AddAB subunit AddA [Staphylococcus lutrae]PNZ39799.1 helicase-exonuclease AddAB subunit AddA [Staphylococcus lutrae]